MSKIVLNYLSRAMNRVLQVKLCLGLLGISVAFKAINNVEY